MESALGSPTAYPMLADTLQGLPSIAVLTAEHDVLRDDGMALVDRLRDEQVDVRHRHVLAFHGALNFAEVTRSGDELMRALVDEIKSL